MNPCEVIRLDKNTNQIYYPTLLLMTRSFRTLGKISKYYNWNISLVANGVDEISFDVNKFYYDEEGNKITSPIWAQLIDLKIIDVEGFGRFEISVSYKDSDETIKSVHGESLEAELGQLILHDFHINDEEAVAGDITKYNEMHFDNQGNFIPTTFYNPNDEDNSLLHRVIKDKAPHWSLGYITPYVTLGEDEVCEKSSDFLRTYSVDGTSIYDFLTGDVAKETNVVFIFDTVNRIINCYSLEDCYDENGNLKASAIGEDTSIMVSKKKLSEEIGIESNKDEVKNCFRVIGGDDLITSQVAAVNMNGSNYIYQFADFQLDDMPDELKNKIISYNEMCDNKRDGYYGINGIYTRLCDAYEQYSYYKSGMMPSTTLTDTTAEVVYNKILSGLRADGVGISSKSYTSTYFLPVSNNVLAMAEVYADYRYNVSLVKDLCSYNGDDVWEGQIKVVRATDDTDYYPKTTKQTEETFSVSIYTDDDGLIFTRQKVEKALSKNDMTDLNSMLSDLETDEELIAFCQQYSLDILSNYRDGYQSCLSVLTEVGNKTSSSVWQTEYDAYRHRYEIVDEVYQERKIQVDELQQTINNITIEQANFQAELDFVSYIGEDLYKVFCSYVREDDYTNSNYISDNLTTTTEYLDKAKELLDVATVQIKKACVLQRTVTTSLHNLLLLPEFANLYESFALFNYIRVACEDEMFKLRIMAINFDGTNYSDIQVTFAEEIESLDGSASTISSVLQQAASISTLYDATVLQVKQGKEASDVITSAEKDGLDASALSLKNSNNDEITFTEAGLIAKKMTDEGVYDDHQVRIVGSGIYMTDDAWATAPKVEITDVGMSVYGDYSISISAEDEKIFNIYGDTTDDSIMYISNNGEAYYKGNLQCGDIEDLGDDTNTGLFVDSNGVGLVYNSTYSDSDYSAFTKLAFTSQIPLQIESTTHAVQQGVDYINQFFIRTSEAISSSAHIIEYNSYDTSWVLQNGFYITGNGTIASSSDRRLKHNIQEITDADKVVNDLIPVQYTMGNSNQYGLIAQDVEETLEKYGLNKEGVISMSDDYYMLNYQSLIPFLISAVKEQQKEIDNLKQEINKLKGSD